MNCKRIIYLMVLILSMFLFKPATVAALTCSQYDSIPTEVALKVVCGDSNTAPNNCCTVGGNNQCPYCTSVCSSSMCSGKPAWTRWKISCKAECRFNGISGIWQAVMTMVQSTSYACSTGDKYRSNANTTALYAGMCDCTTGGAYKFCCDANGNAENARSGGKLSIGDQYPEGSCPGGNGWQVDGNRIRSSHCTPNCVPNCAATDGSHCSGATYAGNCGQTCTGNVGPSCGSAGGHCWGEVYGSDNGCGTCTGTLGSSCGDTNSQCSGIPYGSANGCGSCAGTRAAVTGTTGNCGGSNGGSFTVASPPTNLCASGTASGVSFNGTTYSWTCAGTAGDCGGASGSTVNCSAIRNLPPTFSSIVLKNDVGTAVAAEGGNVNQICQTEFNGVRTFNLTVNATDPNGVGTISDIQLRWNGINFARTGLANGVATFNHTFAAGENTTGATDFQVYISDGVNATGWITTGRSLKVWNCNVTTTGRLYDGGASGSCNVPADYITPATATNFNTLDFTDSPTVNMGRISENEYNGNLTWGKVYTTIFNSDLAMQISGSGVKTTDVSAGTSYCPNSVAITLNNAVLNPYSASPTLRVDFSGAVDQDSWYQTLGGGLLTNSRIVNRVPVTCTTANCAMAINNGINTNGIVASPTINNTGNSGVNKGNPNNWWVTKPLVSTSKSDYTYFLNQYFWKSGIGTTLNGDKNLSDIGATGVVFVNGNLTINTNNSVPVGTFLMMVASGNITIDQSVTNIGGVFVSKNFNIGGSNATALTINGMIKATENLKISRTFVNKRDNNTAPAVNFVYRPDFVFNIPKEIGKQLVKWQWGN